VAAARALIGRPELVIADEPTSALDAGTRDQFLDLVTAEAGETGAGLLMVSHDPGLAPRFDRVLRLADILQSRVIPAEGR
jgi:putative ABC transport system ATP-binding protein